MSPADLDLSEQRALELALRYWAAHWDFECPTLFGLELDELKDVLSHWPHVRSGAEEAAAAALLRALRELIHGASAVPRDTLPGLIGRSYEQAEQLQAKLISMMS
jgi:hypothetical protein